MINKSQLSRNNKSKTPNKLCKDSDRNWEDIEYLRKKKVDFKNKCHQIFNFLDSKSLGYINMDSIDYANTHYVCLSILTDVLVNIIRVKSSLNFDQFYKLIVSKDMMQDIEKIFEALDKELALKFDPKNKSNPYRKDFLDVMESTDFSRAKYLQSNKENDEYTPSKLIFINKKQINKTRQSTPRSLKI